MNKPNEGEVDDGKICHCCGQTRPDWFLEKCVSLKLTEMERRLYAVLSAKPGRVVPKEDIYQSMWTNYEETVPAAPDNNLAVFVVRLNKKMRGIDLFIDNIWGYGYRLLEGAGATNEQA